MLGTSMVSKCFSLISKNFGEGQEFQGDIRVDASIQERKRKQSGVPAASY